MVGRASASASTRAAATKATKTAVEKVVAATVGKGKRKAAAEEKTTTATESVSSSLPRCFWVNSDPLYIKYHDEEWGVVNKDERHMFEMLILEGAQAGLSWITVLKKRDNYRKAFDNFDAEKVAQYDAKKVEELMQNEGIIRNRAKINAAIANAKATLKIREQHGSLSSYLWQFAPPPRTAPLAKDDPHPVDSEESKKMSKSLLSEGFKFVGPTICYSFMQAIGMINDHFDYCFCSQNKASGGGGAAAVAVEKKRKEGNDGEEVVEEGAKKSSSKSKKSRKQ